MRDKLESFVFHVVYVLFLASVVVLPVLAMRGAAWLSLKLHGML